MDGAPRVWMPGVDGMAEDEELQFDPSTYDLLHALQLEWPCLSLDALRDGNGDRRAELPHDVMGVAGSQADSAGNNRLTVFRLSNLVCTRKRATNLDDSDDEGSGSDTDSDDEMADEMVVTRSRGWRHAPSRTRAASTACAPCRRCPTW